jgi:hypothetical protein
LQVTFADKGQRAEIFRDFVNRSRFRNHASTESVAAKPDLLNQTIRVKTTYCLELRLGQRDKIVSSKDLPCADRRWTAGSRSPLPGAAGRAVEKTRQAEQAEAHHAKAHGHENVIEACSEPDRSSAPELPT